jgi:penicillin-binding protein 1C
VVDHQTDKTLVWAVGETTHEQGGSYDSMLTKRQPGSTLKPFVYALAMEQGWTAATTIDDSPLKEGVGQGASWKTAVTAQCIGQFTYCNMPAIKAAQFVGVEPLISTLNKLGIKDLHLGNLKELLVLDLGQNSLSGTIPAELALLKELKNLSLDNNDLTGNVNTLFCDLTTTISYLATFPASVI